MELPHNRPQRWRVALIWVLPTKPARTRVRGSDPGSHGASQQESPACRDARGSERISAQRFAACEIARGTARRLGRSKVLLRNALRRTFEQPGTRAEARGRSRLYSPDHTSRARNHSVYCARSDEQERGARVGSVGQDGRETSLQYDAQAGSAQLRRRDDVRATTWVHYKRKGGAGHKRKGGAGRAVLRAPDLNSGAPGCKHLSHERAQLGGLERLRQNPVRSRSSASREVGNG